MQIRTQLNAQLREQPDDPDRLRRAISAEREDLARLREALEQKPNELDITRLGRVLNRLADHLRLAGECKAAMDCAEEALEIWEELGRQKAAFLARLRVAKIERRRGNLQSALAILDELVETAEEEPLAIYRDFALECRGLCRWEAGENATAPALEDLRACLRLREERGAERQIDRTRRIVEHIRQL